MDEDLILKTCASVHSDKIEKLLGSKLSINEKVKIRNIIQVAYSEAYNKGLNKNK